GALDTPNVNSAFPTTALGNVDIFVAKFDPNSSGLGSLLYFTYIGGTDADVPNGIAVDSGGYVYITGSTKSANFPLAGGGPQNNLNNGVLGDINQNVDAFVVKLNPNESGSNALYYSTFFGGNDIDVGNDIAVDNRGNIFIIGTTKSTDLIVTDDAYQKI